MLYYASMEKRFWLMKTEPDVYSIWDLQRDKKTHWEGIRNYQARNFMRDTMSVSDSVLIYHSNTKEPSIVGLGRVCRTAYTDHFAFDPQSNYYDPKSDPKNPRWVMVDIAYCQTFPNPLSLKRMKAHSELQSMLVIKRGMRLSIQPVTPTDYELVLSLCTQ